MSDCTPVLNYAGRNDDIPLDSRIERAVLEGGGVRYTYPPEGWKRVRVKLAAMAGTTVFALVLLTTITVSWKQFSPTEIRIIFTVLLAAICLSLALWMEAKEQATKPVLIEVQSGELHVTRPHLWQRRYRWAAGKVHDIRCGATLPYIDLKSGVRLVSSLLIVSPSMMAMRLLDNHDVNEIAWIVRELRAALELPD